VAQLKHYDILPSIRIFQPLEHYLGGMMERKEVIIPAEVMMAKQILSRLGDYSAMAEEDDVVSNIRALAGLLVSLGKKP
jgi:hypothetical protein